VFAGGETSADGGGVEADATRDVAAEVAVVVPFLFEAVTATRSV
jgi:hypothetical protein